jgi:mono/diheme cytochrome c family protein
MNRITMIIGWTMFVAVAGTAHAGGRSVAQPALVPSGLIVTQFAVPVAVPQYAIPVAPQSYVQYGGHVGATAPALDALEDRIVARVLQGLRDANAQDSAVPRRPSLVVKHCGACHAGPEPKAELDLSDLSSLDASRRLECVSRVLSDDPAQRMPPAASATRLSAEDVGRLLQELSQSKEAR